jgi:hypothetical protein
MEVGEEPLATRYKQRLGIFEPATSVSTALQVVSPQAFGMQANVNATAPKHTLESTATNAQLRMIAGNTRHSGLLSELLVTVVALALEPTRITFPMLGYLQLWVESLTFFSSAQYAL